jgi:TetR/AcrR family transcriptional regulator, tetracycline repressor protein
VVEREKVPETDPAAEEVPAPPWLRARARRARPPLSREAIVDAALRVLDRQGAAGLSMRRIAEELGTGPGAIYWHVENKEQLIQLVFDRVIAELPLPEPDPEGWQEQLKQAARDERAVMQRHPGIAQLSFGRVPIGPNAVRYFEWHLSVLRAGGVPDRIAALAGDLINLWVGAFAYEESLGMRTPAGSEAPVEDFIAEMREYLAALPADRFPNLVELADEIMAPGLDERFEFGLDILVGGLVARSQRG